MSRFDRLDAADSHMGRVLDQIRRRAAASGLDAWNNDPALRQARERSVRLLVRAVNRRDREEANLVNAGVPEGVVHTRLRDRAEDRYARAVRDSRPAGRAAARAGR